MREDFLSIKKMIEQAKKDKISLLKQTIPGLSNINSWEILEQLGYLFNEQKFLKNDYLSHQGDKSMTMYLLVSGQLEISSKVQMEVGAPQQKYMSKLNKFITGQNEIQGDKRLNKSMSKKIQIQDQYIIRINFLII